MQTAVMFRNKLRYLAHSIRIKEVMAIITFLPYQSEMAANVRWWQMNCVCSLFLFFFYSVHASNGNCGYSFRAHFTQRLSFLRMILIAIFHLIFLFSLYDSLENCNKKMRQQLLLYFLRQHQTKKNIYFAWQKDISPRVW